MGDTKMGIRIELGDEDNKIIYELDEDESREFLNRLRNRDYDTEYQKNKAIAEIVGDIKNTPIEIPDRQTKAEKLKNELIDYKTRLERSLIFGFLSVGILEVILEGDWTAFLVFAALFSIQTLKLVYNLKYDNGIREKMRELWNNYRN